MNLFFLCLKIFIGRLIDVSLGTLVTIYVVKNKRNLATLIGFIDVFIWFIVVKEALNTNENSIFIVLSYCFGYASGTYIGSLLSSFFSKGTVNIQVITNNNEILNELKKSNYPASIIKCIGLHKEDDNILIFSQINIKEINDYKKLIMNIDKNAFITIIENKESINGYISK